ncbi:MAG TPA: TetR family transcriptional regulator [Bacteroidia bacterium]|nr:TetR family transcriptional regulator [Bacteroidia bacterium]
MKGLEITTEEKIKQAARIIFHQKGFAATRTRDIAAEAGINLALLNYYFRSKEKLFDLIMLESIQIFLSSVKLVFDDEQTSFEVKVEQLADKYIDQLIKHPELPLFLLSELRSNPESLMSKIGIKEIVMNSFFLKQFKAGVKDGKYVDINPLHLIMNLMGMTVFPFIASPIVRGMGNLSQQAYTELMLERKTFIPMWMKAILKT